MKKNSIEEACKAVLNEKEELEEFSPNTLKAAIKKELKKIENDISWEPNTGKPRKWDEAPGAKNLSKILAAVKKTRSDIQKNLELWRWK
jgi:hypothetical protein